ncbi:hypothetical protein B0H19DRAFT_1079456 [Mycena capillaripes]|nr:hypothetical protein B0H19DRAFT_1079456 [Mycena capillaripes]
MSLNALDSSGRLRLDKATYGVHYAAIRDRSVVGGSHYDFVDANCYPDGNRTPFRESLSKRLNVLVGEVACIAVGVPSNGSCKVRDLFSGQLPRLRYILDKDSGEMGGQIATSWLDYSAQCEASEERRDIFYILLRKTLAERAARRLVPGASIKVSAGMERIDIAGKVLQRMRFLEHMRGAVLQPFAVQQALTALTLEMFIYTPPSEIQELRKHREEEISFEPSSGGGIYATRHEEIVHAYGPVFTSFPVLDIPVPKISETSPKNEVTGCCSQNYVDVALMYNSLVGVIDSLPKVKGGQNASVKVKIRVVIATQRHNLGSPLRGKARYLSSVFEGCCVVIHGGSSTGHGYIQRSATIVRWDAFYDKSMT